MFVLNDNTINPADLSARLDRVLSAPGTHRYGLHMRNTGAALSSLLHLREQNAGVFPIHADIPPETARAMAETAGCDVMLSDGLKQTPLPQAGPAPRGGILVQMSSGTTGAAKVITRTWDEIAVEVESYAAFFTASAEMTPVIACPVTHSYGLIAGALVALHRGHVPVIIDSLNPKYILRRLREVDQPLLYTSPAMLHTLARLLPKEEVLHAVNTSGTVLPDAWFSLIRSRTTHFFQQYGCSEAGCVAINQNLQDPCDVGRALPHVTLDAGRDSGPGPVRITTGGRGIDTGDLGCLRPDGMLVFTARADDMINVAGLNVYPHDVEKTVMAVPGVQDAVAFRVADPHSGDRVGLLYSGSATEEDLRRACLGALAGYQQPGQIHRLPALPRQANGKISRREVAAQYSTPAKFKDPVSA
ncbi:AMP-binding protein [Leisingera sp. ANG-Vp]|uniref:AMP-binding protein n=1 Tax=Leisingera sp. ANG-Vp TaxID=1577896 RepID=UPI00057E840F|nr:AMP-binding protein [Leisingera sp. ANG-Vp]KIC20025.1 acyl-CoA synthetase [Leisingera sp. ANG-Vp]